MIWAGGVVFAILMVLSTRYGFHRDELYFLDCARHLQASYVDQPVLTPLLARVSLSLFGVSLPGLRLWSALAAGGTVVISGLTARELGGGRRAQLLAAVAAGTMPSLLAVGHVFGPTTLDMLAWAALALVVIRIGRTGEARWWLAAGAILGVGLANKHSIGFFALALVLGALLSGGWKMVANRWFAAGAAIAAAFTVPDLWWQAQHQWATITMTQALNHENGGLGHIGTWVIGQLLIVTLALVWVWLAGLRLLWRSRRPLCGRWCGPTGCCSSSSPSPPARRSTTWPAPTLPARRRHGGHRRLAGGPARPGPHPAARRRGDDRGGAAAGAAGPPGRRHRLDLQGRLPQWRDHRLAPAGPGRAKVWVSLPPAQRARTVIFTTNYGEAGAINNLGRTDGLPTAVSGHNSEWWWGPGNPAPPRGCWGQNIPFCAPPAAT